MAEPNRVWGRLLLPPDDHAAGWASGEEGKMLHINAECILLIIMLFIHTVSTQLSGDKNQRITKMYMLNKDTFYPHSGVDSSGLGIMQGCEKEGDWVRKQCGI